TSNANPKLSATAPITVVSVGFLPISPMAAPRSGHTTTLLRDGRVLIAGGTTAAAHSAELFLPASSSFTATAGGMIHVRMDHCAALLQDGRVLIAGGGDGHGTLFGAAELFDPATQSFLPTGGLNHARTRATATLLPNGKVLVLGGTQIMPPLGGGAAPGPVSLNSAEVYDPATGMFQPAGKLLMARDSHSATVLANGTVLVTGGYVHDFDGDAQ